MDVTSLHPWDLSPREAIALQRELASRVVRTGDIRARDVRLIAGCDAAFDKPRGRGAGAVVVLSYPELQEVERVSVEAPVTFPYVPGLLSFRETPLLLDAFEHVRSTPDLLMVDGHGYAHPRRFGFACHIGVTLGVPTIGVAKSPLIGAHLGLDDHAGARADLTDSGEVIGSVLRTRERVRPVFVSIGHRVSLAAAERWAMACAQGYRVPAPTRLADVLSREAKRRMLDATLTIVIEQRAGERGRWEWVAEEDAVMFRHDLPAMPTHYGCSIELMNDADGELLDVMLLDDRPRERNEKLDVRVIDVLEREDGDHKLMALPVDVAPFTSATQRRLAAERKTIWRWYIEMEKPVTRWAGEEAAIALIRRCRAGVQ